MNELLFRKAWLSAGLCFLLASCGGGDCDSRPGEKHAASPNVANAAGMKRPYAQRIWILGYEQRKDAALTGGSILSARVRYELAGSTELGTVRVILMGGGEEQSQRHKLIKEGVGEVVIPVEYRGGLAGRTLLAVLYRDEQDASGVVDKRIL